MGLVVGIAAAAAAVVAVAAAAQPLTKWIHCRVTFRRM